MLRAVVRPTSSFARVAHQVRAASSSVPKVQFDPSDKTPKDKAPGQSPNVPQPWSKSQQPKEAAFNNPRFEQVYVPTQPDSLSAMGLVDEQPVVKVQGRRAVCDGGEFTMGGMVLGGDEGHEQDMDTGSLNGTERQRVEDGGVE